MMIVHKLGKLAKPVTYERAWRRAQRYLFPLPLRPIVAGLDQARLREIQARYREVPRGFAKYTDVDHYLRLNCGWPITETIEGGLRRLGEIASECAAMQRKAA